MIVVNFEGVKKGGDGGFSFSPGSGEGDEGKIYKKELRIERKTEKLQTRISAHFLRFWTKKQFYSGRLRRVGHRCL